MSFDIMGVMSPFLEMYYLERQPMDVFMHLCHNVFVHCNLFPLLKCIFSRLHLALWWKWKFRRWYEMIWCGRTSIDLKHWHKISSELLIKCNSWVNGSCQMFEMIEMISLQWIWWFYWQFLPFVREKADFKHLLLHPVLKVHSWK